MPSYRITNTGTEIGVFTGYGKTAALDAYARTVGYASFEAACLVTGDDPDTDGGLTVEECSTGALHDYETDDYIRPATAEEWAMSCASGGAIEVDGRWCYVAEA